MTSMVQTKNLIYNLKIMVVDVTILQITDHDYDIIPKTDLHPSINFRDNIQTPTGTQIRRLVIL